MHEDTEKCPCGDTYFWHEKKIAPFVCWQCADCGGFGEPVPIVAPVIPSKPTTLLGKVKAWLTR
jgi:hypothetical protein